MNEIVKIAYDTYKYGSYGNYSKADSLEVLRDELILANNGSTKLDYKAIRDGKCVGLFSIIEQILTLTSVDEFERNDFFMNFVDYINVGLGDENKFIVPNNSLFVFSETAEGTQGIRRQRLNTGKSMSVTTSLKTVRIFEEINRMLSGRVDFNEFISLVSRSSTKRKFYDIYTAWNGITNATLGTTYYPTQGTYNEEQLLDLVSHVEAETGRNATILCTKKGARKLKMEVSAEQAKNDIYDLGYLGKFYGVSVVTMKQSHIGNTSNFLLDDNKYYVVAFENKPIKFVTEGEGLLIMDNVNSNADMTQNFLYGERDGVGIVVADKFGIYETSSN